MLPSLTCFSLILSLQVIRLVVHSRSTISPFPAMVDRTVYPSKDRTPDLALRQIFGRHRLPDTLCLVFANNSLLSIEMVAVLGENHASVRANFLKLVGGEAAISNEPQVVELSLLRVVTIWTTCQALNACFAQRRAKMEEDPHKIPEISQEDHGDFRSRFIQAHPDTIVNIWNEPHRKFVERINRDFTVNGTVPFYEVGEMRTRSETIAQKTGLAPSADQLVRLCKVDEPASSVANEEEVLYRLQAFFMALEMLNICSLSAVDGPVRYLNELHKFRKHNPGLHALVRADKIIRLAVAECNTDERDLFPTFSEALLHVLNHKQFLWNDARTDVRMEAMSSTPPRKRQFSELEEDSTKSPNKVSKSAKRRAALKAKLTSGPPSHQQASRNDQPSKGKGKGKAKGSTAGSSDNKIPPAEWTKLCSFKSQGAPKCRFFNSSRGCTAGSECKQLHKCLQCGADHSWFSHHGSS